MAKPTVVSLPVWGAGHFMPMIEFGKRLLRASGGALSATVLLMPAPTPQQASLIADHVRREEAAAGDDIRFQRLPDVELPTDHTGIEEFISRVVRSHVPHVRAAIAGLERPPAALVFNIFCTPALDASRELAVPTYVYFTSAGAMLALFLRTPALDVEVAVEFEEMDGPLDVPGLLPLPASALPDTMLQRKKSTYEWYVYTGRRYMDVTGFIVNTAAELEPSVLAAIADGRCTGGIAAPTVHPIGPRSGHRFLWVLRGPPEDSRHGTRDPTDATLDELLPEGFLERTKGRGLVWPTRAPQADILAHAAVGGFVTHCGWNSILESLWFGVPMLPWPLGAEQHMNAFTLVAAMGVAVPLEVDRKRGNFVEAAELERAVRSLMGGGEEGRKAREKALELKAICRKAVEESGSSLATFEKLTEEIFWTNTKNESVKPNKSR
uniref:Glycosyltransferase n=1 Tax=Oryza meridionalis TaxID=40149 RepID=A0A0E0D1M6_9ORYZ